MIPTFKRTVTITVNAVSLDGPLSVIETAHLRADSFRRLQRALGALIDQGITSGTLTYQQQHPHVNLNWSISVQDQGKTEGHP